MGVVRAVVGGVEVDAPRDIPCLDDIAFYPGTADLAPYFTRTGSGAF